jgi:hypothetical protein
MSNTICMWQAGCEDSQGPSAPMAYLIDGTTAHPSAPGQAPVAITGADPLAFLVAHWSNTREADHTILDAGQYYPRMFRGDSHGFGHPIVNELDESSFGEFLTSVEQEGIVCDDLAAICRVVQPSPQTASAYGSKIRNLLLTTCTEVESQLKGILTANGCGRRRCTQDYVKTAVPMRLDQFTVRATRYREYPPIAPFKGWDANAPTQSLPWYDVYNDTKHDRQGHLHRATLGHALSAVAALNVLLIAQYGLPAIDRYSIAFPFFTLEASPSWHPRERSYSAPRDRPSGATNFPF